MMVLKVVTVFVCAWLIDTGRLLHYFEELRQLHGLDTKDPIAGVSIDERWWNVMSTVPAKGWVSATGLAARTSTQSLSPSTESVRHNSEEPQVSIALFTGPVSAAKAFFSKLGFGGTVLPAMSEQYLPAAPEKVSKGSVNTEPPTDGAESNNTNLPEG
jgi:hypothetical protein